jgi:hypothetical protein
MNTTSSILVVDTTAESTAPEVTLADFPDDDPETAGQKSRLSG